MAELDKEYEELKILIDKNKSYLNKVCYKTNNRFAYLKDLNGIEPESEMKLYNFTPTYDKWCLYCDNKNCKFNCSSCKLIYYCNKDCQKKSWFIHKNHCKRDLFCVCILCGKDNPKITCDKCPVKYCDNICKDKIEISHQEYDCATYQQFKK